MDAGVLHPSRRPYRFAVLLFAAGMIFGSYFAYDSLGAIESLLIDELGIGRNVVGATYTMYSLAAIPAVLAGGFLVDRLGTRRASLVFSSFIVAGAVLVALAPNVGTIYAGRLLFGMGSESLIVCQSAILARWFTGRELALAFGIALTVSRLGTLFSFNTEALVAQRFGIAGALWLAAGLCGLSLLSNLACNLLDRRARGALGLVEGSAGDRIVVADIARFRPSFWYVTFLCLTFYSAIFPFTALSTDFFHEKWGLPLTAADEGAGFLAQVLSNYLHLFSTAGGTTSIVILASMLCAPFAGRLVDRVGRRASLMVAGALLLVVAHLALGLTALPPAAPMVVLGAAFVLVPAAMWPSVPLLVEKERVGTAFGLMTAIQNVGLMAFPWLNGQLRDLTRGWVASQVLFACLGAGGFLCALLLLRADRRAGGRLERA